MTIRFNGSANPERVRFDGGAGYVDIDKVVFEHGGVAVVVWESWPQSIPDVTLRCADGSTAKFSGLSLYRTSEERVDGTLRQCAEYKGAVEVSLRIPEWRSYGSYADPSPYRAAISAASGLSSKHAFLGADSVGAYVTCNYYNAANGTWGVITSTRLVVDFSRDAVVGGISWRRSGADRHVYYKYGSSPVAVSGRSVVFRVYKKG